MKGEERRQRRASNPVSRNGHCMPSRAVHRTLSLSTNRTRHWCRNSVWRRVERRSNTKFHSAVRIQYRPGRAFSGQRTEKNRMPPTALHQPHNTGSQLAEFANPARRRGSEAHAGFVLDDKSVARGRHPRRFSRHVDSATDGRPTFGVGALSAPRVLLRQVGVGWCPDVERGSR